jgi:hypothetical protein
MELFDLTAAQLRRAASTKEKLDALNREHRSLLDGSPSNRAASREEADDQRAGEKENCGCTAGEMGEA